MSMATIVSSSTTMMRTSGIRPPLWWERDPKLGASAGRDFHRTVDLLHQAADEAQSERLRALGVEPGPESAPVVTDGEDAETIPVQLQSHVDRAPRAACKRVLERVREQLVHDQTARYGD